MFTGGFQNMSRSEAKSKVENNGESSRAMSSKLDLPIVGDSKPTKKIYTKELKIKIITEKRNKIFR